MKNEILSELISVDENGIHTVDRLKLSNYLDELSHVLLDIDFCANVPADSSLSAYLHQAWSSLVSASTAVYLIR